MNKKTIKASAAAVALAGACLIGAASCSGNKYKSMNEAADSAATEAPADVAPLETAKSAISDSTLINKYDGAFFDNSSNKGNPSEGKWAQTASGLKYVILTPGSGAAPTADQQVTVHYVGYLPYLRTVRDAQGKDVKETSLKVFDSSLFRGQPATFPLNGVIKGWTEGLQLMHPGGTAAFYIPADLAYGKNGAGEDIGPDQPLIFLVELISVDR